MVLYLKEEFIVFNSRLVVNRLFEFNSNAVLVVDSCELILLPNFKFVVNEQLYLLLV